MEEEKIAVRHCIAYFLEIFLEGKQNFSTEVNIFDSRRNKTAGYLRDVSRPPTLLKMPFRRMKVFVFQNILFLHQIFYFFQL